MTLRIENIFLDFFSGFVYESFGFFIVVWVENYSRGVNNDFYLEKLGCAGVYVEFSLNNLAFLAIFLFVGGSKGHFDGLYNLFTRNTALFFELLKHRIDDF